MIKSQYYDYVDELYHDDKNVNIVLLPKNYVRKSNETSVIISKNWNKDEDTLIKEIINAINNYEPIKPSSPKKIKSVINSFKSDKPYLILTNGTTGSLKTKMAEEIIKDLKLSTNNTKINIDDLVVNNKDSLLGLLAV